MKVFDVIPLILTLSLRGKGLLNFLEVFRTTLVGLESNTALKGAPTLSSISGR
jgi:hypothetical protein